MYSKTTRFENWTAWLGYLGILPFILGIILLLDTGYAQMALAGIKNYAAVILTFIGAIHWGRAMDTHNPGLLPMSIVPSLVAWCALFMMPRYALPVLMVGFILLFIFDYRQYQDTPWFQRLRTHLTVSVGGLLMLRWIITPCRGGKIAISGSTGFIGKHLVSELRQRGYLILPIGRHELSRGAKHLALHISGCDALINLAGAPINKRWSSSYKREIVSSRVDSTRLLIQAMRLLERPPTTFISTSAIGAFTSQGRYTEADSPNATDFLGQLSKGWEAAANEAETLGIRTLIFRFALVLGHDGGLIKQLLLPFRLGLGGPIGDGSQHFSWIHIDDLINVYLLALDNKEMSGVYHLSAPNPVSNLDFTRTLGAILHRPTLFHVPGLMLKMAYGEGVEVMTSGQCAISKRLPEAGVSFRYPELAHAIRDIVQKSEADCPMSGLCSSSLKS